MSRTPRALVVVGVAVLLASCTAMPPDGERTEPAPSTAPTPTAEPVHTAETRLPTEPTTALEAVEPAALAVATSELFFEAAPVAVLAPVDDVAAQLRASSIAVTLGAPLLLTAATPSDVHPAPGPEPTAAPGPTTVDPTASAGPGASPAPTASAEPTQPSEPTDPTAIELNRLGTLAVVTVGAVSDVVAAGEGTLDELVVVSAPDDDEALAEVLRTEPLPAPVAEAVPGGEVSAVAALTAGGEGEVASPSPTPTASAGQTTSPNGTSSATSSGPTSSPGPSATAQDLPRLPLLEQPDPLTGALLLTVGDLIDVAPVATARAVGVQVIVVPSGDPRLTSESVQAVAAAQAEVVIGLGAAFGGAETLGWTVATAATGVELPGGGQVLFPGRRMVALYGTPGTSALGLLGEQDLPGSIARAQGMAAEYQALTSDVVVPAFEIIVTIASAGAGDDGNYSNELPVESFVPWIEAARDAGVYVVLDLQPGRTDFVTQAKLYEQLLLYPNVGLALDPEWRLLPHQVHLKQIGSVHIDEVNAVGDYLAALTRDNALPQKLFVLHQFSHRMIQSRELLDTSHRELAVMIHVDGQGSQPAKAGTWTSLRAGTPPGIAWGWKNFIDEDVPMLTPQQTYQVQPVPELVTYQ